MSFRILLGLILGACAAGRGFTADGGFLRHTLNADATYCAAAAIDVNGDGKLDVVSGGFWYAAPDWKRHVLREVEQIRGRFDDYSNLPLDVNGDGRLDLVSANYRSRKLFWIEQPARPGDRWPLHLIAEPGPMETARLADIDGDGRLDVLPNGVEFAAWWELAPTAPGAAPRFLRHDLPSEVAGHGVGFGDLNGDGRGDIVGPRGWLEAPADRRQERWLWRPEFQLHRDASIPILVEDVDGDGLRDLIWGRAHSIGLYWARQEATSAGRRFTTHAIDTSWSQAHSLLWVDLDGDNRPELVAGKRYLGHDGRDPGELDPLGVYAYRFEPATRTWTRRTIDEGSSVGWGLDPKAVDLDGDGDLDLIAPGRSGLYVLENLRHNRAGSVATEPPPGAPEYSDHGRLLVYRDAQGREQPVTNDAQWRIRRAHLLAHMQAVMGPLPDSSRRAPLDVEILESVDTPRYVRHSLTYVSEPGDRVPAYLLVPKNLAGPAPAMLCLHQTTGIGKGEPAGLGGRPSLRYAHELAERGFVCLAPDYPSFGDYRYDFKTQGAAYASGSMKAIWNNLRAVDLLETRPEVLRDKIGVIGHSLGGHNSLFTAAFDQRLTAVVTSCGFTPFPDYYGGKLAGWTSDRYMPRIRDRYQNDAAKLPFDFEEVLGAIAPRAIFVCAPERDDNFAVAGVRKCEARVGELFDLLGRRAQLAFRYPDSAHDFPDATRREAYDWLAEKLK